MKPLLIGLVFLGSIASAQSDASTKGSKHIEKLLAGADGSNQATAYKVSSVHEEYEILNALHLSIKVQALVVGKKPYDAITAVDPSTGSERKIWFDISSFYPEF